MTRDLGLVAGPVAAEGRVVAGDGDDLVAVERDQRVAAPMVDVGERRQRARAAAV